MCILQCYGSLITGCCRSAYGIMACKSFLMRWSRLELLHECKLDYDIFHALRLHISVLSYRDNLTRYLQTKYAVDIWSSRCQLQFQAKCWSRLLVATYRLLTQLNKDNVGTNANNNATIKATTSIDQMWAHWMPAVQDGSWSADPEVAMAAWSISLHYSQQRQDEIWNQHTVSHTEQDTF